MEMKKKMEMKMEKKLTNIGLAAILVIAVFVAVTGIASAQTHYNESGNYIEGINVSVNTSEYFNRSCINVPLTFQINTLNASATSFNVTNQSGLTTNATGSDLAANEWFWVNASSADTYWVNVSNNDNQSEYVNFTVEYSPPVKYIEGINVSVNTSDAFNRSRINVPLMFQINNTLNDSATSFNVTNQSGLTTNATGSDLAANEWFWVNASIAGTYWVNVSNNDNQSEYVNFTVEYFFPVETIRIKPETLNLNLKSKGKFTAFITLPEGYDVEDINNSTVECEGAPAVRGRVSEEDDDTYIVKFNRQDLVNVSTGDEVPLTVTGKLNDGTPFEGNYTIRVIDKGRWGPKFAIVHLFDKVKNLGEGVRKRVSAFGIADEAASPPGTTPPVPTNTMHVDNITVSTDNRSGGPNTFVWAVAAVTIVVDDSDSQVEGAKVSGQWSGATSDRSSGVTDANGQVSLESGSVRNPSGETTFTFTVDDVVKTDWTYNSSANEETSASVTV